jgi:hypothetical protein
MFHGERVPGGNNAKIELNPFRDDTGCWLRISQILQITLSFLLKHRHEDLNHSLPLGLLEHRFDGAG